MIFKTKSMAIEFLESQGCYPRSKTKMYSKLGCYKVPKGHLTRPYYCPVKKGSKWVIYRNYLLINGVEMKEMVHKHEQI